TLRTILGASAVVVAFAAAAPALAQTTTPSTNIEATTKIACVGSAVNIREQAIDSAITTYTGALTAAYSARATALQQAYTNTTLAATRVAVRAAWSTFSASAKSGRKSWQTARNTAWNTYRTAAVACRAPVGTGDGAFSLNDVSGN
ncbi:MAG: hypothetical protein ACREGR_05015, partial [Minisyncoccia bacterium]